MQILPVQFFLIQSRWTSGGYGGTGPPCFELGLKVFFSFLDYNSFPDGMLMRMLYILTS